MRPIAVNPARRAANECAALRESLQDSANRPPLPRTMMEPSSCTDDVGADPVLITLDAVRTALPAAPDVDAFFGQLSSRLKAADPSLDLGWCSLSETSLPDGDHPTLQFADNVAQARPLRGEMQSIAARCLATQRDVECSSSVAPACLMHAFVSDVGDRTIVVVAQQQTRFVAHRAQIIRMLHAEWDQQLRVGALQQLSEQLAAASEMIGAVQEAEDAGTAAFRLSERLCRFLDADRVAIGLCRAGSRCCRLVALSDQDLRLASQEDAAEIESVLQESVARGGSAVWPVEDETNRHALMAHQHLASRLQLLGVATAPMTNSDGTTVGAVAVLYSSSPREDASPEDKRRRLLDARQFLDAVGRPLAGCLGAIQRLADSRILNGIRVLRHSLSQHRRVVLVSLCTVILVLALVPWPYRVGCECQLQPATRRFIAAPFAAPLLRCEVRPGETVTAGQLLALLDGREIRWELASVEAELNRATKERNIHLSTHQSGEAAIALHEVEHLTSRAELLRSRADNLEIRSPIAGVVVAGDHEDSEGIPLETGQSLFEIAPLDRMVVELELPEEEIRFVREGMEYRVQWNADPAHAVTGELLRIHPRAELRRNDNVFIAEAELDNPRGRFRPGMRGFASVETGLQPLGWKLFHKPISRLRGWTGW